MSLSETRAHLVARLAEEPSQETRQDLQTLVEFCNYYDLHPFEPISKPIDPYGPIPPAPVMENFGLDKFYLDFCNRDAYSIRRLAKLAYQLGAHHAAELLAVKISTLIHGKTPGEIENLF